MNKSESSERREAGSAEEQGMRDVLPAIAKLTVTIWVRAAARGVEGSLSLGSRLAHAATNPGEAVDLVTDVSDGLRSYAREFLGVTDLDDRVKQLAPPGGGLARGERTSEIVLRKQGAELLRQAADVDHEDGAHPAYARIIRELAPDEARILRLLAIDGAQPSVDVRAGNLIGMGSQLVSSGMNMIGPQAGVRHRDKVPAYLNNLYRLGLIWFSHEPLEDPVRYQVLEAQPEVLEAIKETTRAKTVQRSIHLTPFGQDFCDVCLPLDIEELEELTAGGQPVDV
jgi:Abortive infection alpha